MHEPDEGDASTGSSAEHLLEDLTPAQAEAVSSDAAPLIVVASAGAGKTRVLTRRIAYRVSTGTADASHVLALTFTRKAAGEMQDRLHALGLRGHIAAGTFHSIAAAQLRRWWADRRRSAPTLLERKSRLLGPLATARPALAATPLADLASVIEWATARMVSPDRLADAVKAHGRLLPPGVSADEIAALFARYEHEKTRRGLIDFDDLLAGCADAMERDPSFAAAQRWRWRHIFVDEFQDLNPLQFRLLLTWMGPGSDLCAVGDPNQAIYGWNGADAGLLSGVADRWPDTEVVSLDDNHRCTPQIVKAAAAVLGSEGSKLTSTRPSGPDPTVHGYPSETAEAQGTALAIRRAHLDGRPWSEMAVIARTNAQLVALQEALSAAGVPFWAPSPDAEPADEAATRVAVDVTPKGDPGRGADSVTLCTFHRAKGLEWDAVWVVGLEEGFVPIARAGTDRALDEERRLLYVALTRASRELHCSWARQRSFGGRPIPREPSPWLKLISPPSCTPDSAEAGDDEIRIEFWRDRLRSQRQALAAVDPRPGRRLGRPRQDSPGWPAPDPQIIADLRLWRSQAARGSGVPPYVILHDVTLSAVASLRPRSHDELLSVPGMGPVKASRYGATLLAIVAKKPVSA